MSPQTTPAANLPSSSATEAHIPSTDVPDDPAAAASAEIFAAMNGSTLAEEAERVEDERVEDEEAGERV